MILEHYSKAPILWRTTPYEQSDPKPYGKPRGLWLSVPGEDDWPSWCAGEEFGLDRLEHCQRFSLRPGHNVLIIGDSAELHQFHERYSVPQRGVWRKQVIDWNVVAAEYDGIIIAPYQWENRMSETVEWYYTWDCASGCVWNLDVLEPAPLLPPNPENCNAS